MDPVSLAVVAGVIVLVILACKPDCHCGADEQVLELLRAQLTRCGPENLERQGGYLSAYLLGAALGVSLGLFLGIFVSFKYALGGKVCAGREQAGVVQRPEEQTGISALGESEVREAALRSLNQLRIRGSGPRALER
eukprot:6480919-Amphidinium_carterae.1